MPEDTYPTPYREGGYQDGLKRAIMRRVSGPQKPTAAPMHVRGPLMPTGRLLRTPERPGFPLTRPPRPLPIETRQPFPRPLQPWPFRPRREEEGFPGERIGQTERMRQAWLESLASRLPGLESAGMEEPPGALPPVERLEQTDPWEALLGSISPSPGGLAVQPEIPSALGGMTPQMLMAILQRLFAGGIGS